MNSPRGFLENCMSFFLRTSFAHSVCTNLKLLRGAWGNKRQETHPENVEQNTKESSILCRDELTEDPRIRNVPS